VALPGNANDLANAFTPTQYGEVLNNDDIYFCYEASNIPTKLFKWTHVNDTDNISVTWRGKTTLNPATSPVYMQIYNFTIATWETLDFDNSTAINTEFELNGLKNTSVGDYYDASNIVAVRVYQEII